MRTVEHGCRRVSASSDAVLLPSGRVFAVVGSEALLDSLRGELAAHGVNPKEVLSFFSEQGAQVLEGGWCASRARCLPFAVYCAPGRLLVEAYARAAREGRYVVGVPAHGALRRDEVHDLFRSHIGRLAGYFSLGGSIELLDS